jgi:hypothetical protein
MSDVSVLSHEYKTASELSQILNDALILVKKSHWALPGAGEISEEALTRARTSLANIVASLAQLLGAPNVGEEAPEVLSAPAVSGSLVSRVREEHSGDLSYFLDDLAALARRLREPETRLTDADLRLLDELASAADAETSNVFRRLMRT